MRHWLAGAIALTLMTTAAALSVALKPTEVLVKQGEIDLASMVPTSFAHWQTDTSIMPLPPSPEVKATLEKAYDQTLERTYRDDQGHVVMLSIAHGGHQDQSMQMHRPEICYPAQGFNVLQAGQDSVLSTQFGNVPIRRLVAGNSNRVEPITYWLVVGNERIRFGWEHRLMTLKYGLTGKVPDGMLIRVSTLGADTEQQYQVHQAFIEQMLASLSAESRKRLLGEAPGT